MRNTKIVHQVTLKHMKMNMKRTLISVIGIALMVMLLTTVLVGKDTAYQYFIDIVSARKGAYHYAVYNLDKKKLEKYIDNHVLYMADLYDTITYLLIDAELTAMETLSAVEEYRQRFGEPYDEADVPAAEETDEKAEV